MTGYDGEEIGEPERPLNEIEHVGASYQRALEKGMKEDDETGTYDQA